MDTVDGCFASMHMKNLYCESSLSRSVENISVLGKWFFCFGKDNPYFCRSTPNDYDTGIVVHEWFYDKNERILLCRQNESNLGFGGGSKRSVLQCQKKKKEKEKKEKFVFNGAAFSKYIAYYRECEYIFWDIIL